MVFQRREIRHEPIFEPLLQLVPTAFDGVQFREFRTGSTRLQGIVYAHARGRTVSDSFDLALTTHVLPEILRIEVARSVQKHH